jgi:hypothetical protein
MEILEIQEGSDTACSTQKNQPRFDSIVPAMSGWNVPRSVYWSWHIPQRVEKFGDNLAGHPALGRIPAVGSRTGRPLEQLKLSPVPHPISNALQGPIGNVVTV